MARTLIALLTLGLTGCVTAADSEPRDMIVIEAESTAPVGDWVLASGLTNASGDAYLRWDGPNHYEGATGPALSYEIDLPTNGRYVVALRTQRVKAGRDIRDDLENDLWIRTSHDFPPGVGETRNWVKIFLNHDWDEWGWASCLDMAHYTGIRPIVEFEFPAGKSRIEIAGRSEGVHFDQLVMIPIETTPADAVNVLTGPTAQG